MDADWSRLSGGVCSSGITALGAAVNDIIIELALPLSRAVGLRPIRLHVCPYPFLG